MLQFSSVFRATPDYPLGDLPQIKAALRARGVDVIDLGAGDADLSPPPAAIEALRQRVLDPVMSRYPFQAGLPDFRAGIVRWMEERFGVRLDPAREVLPIIGSKEAIAHTAFLFVEQGTFSIVPDPGYQPYAGGTRFAGGTPHLVPLTRANDFLIPLGALPVEVVRKSRILYLNYPNNPTGALAPREYLADAVRFCQDHGILLVYDNAYSEFGFDGYRAPSIFEIDGALDVALEFHSLSKTYNMTGWRIGWVAGHARIIGALAKMKNFFDTGAFLPIQAAATAALRCSAEWVPGNIEAFRERRDAAVRALRAAGFDATSPRATMYLWIPVPVAMTSEEFARAALTQQGVVVMPGSAQGRGGEGYFRVALTQPVPRLEEAAGRLGTLLYSLSAGAKAQ
jgi:LL-diaminopimelate aminotransferase